MRRSLVAALTLAAALAGCGGSDHERVNPETMLDQASQRPIPSADVEVEARLQVVGVEQLSRPVRLRVEGPYVSGGGERIPSFDWRLSASALGFPIGGRLVSTGDDVYLSLYGDVYTVGTAAVEAANARIREAAAGTGSPLELDPRSWFGRARVVGEGSAGGTDCERITAPLRREAASRDLAPLAAELGLSEVPNVWGTATACVGYEDRLFHELELSAVIGVPPADRARLGGATGALLDANVVIGDVGESERISAPGGPYEPIRNLFLTLNDLGVPVPY
jgi:hypothetical protein